MKNWSEIRVSINDSHTYRVLVGRGILRDALSEERLTLSIIASGVAEKARWVTEEMKEVSKEIMILEDGEENKTLDTVLKIVEKLWNLGADRWSKLAVVGGGSVGDTAAFASSVYLRGIPYISVPTTLLAMIDSSLGGKTAVNWRGYKNILGSFYHPELVVSDLRFVDTLPERVFRSSLAEALKYGFVLNADLLDFMLQHKEEILRREDEELSKLIAESAKTKLEVVAIDPRERKGVREVLNFGHTVGHALESASRFELLHGEAVALGMLIEAAFADLEGFCNACRDLVEEALGRYGLLEVRRRAPRLTKEEYKELIYRDKKRVGSSIRLPVMTGKGEWRLGLVPIDEFVERTYMLLKELLWS